MDAHYVICPVCQGRYQAREVKPYWDNKTRYVVRKHYRNIKKLPGLSSDLKVVCGGSERLIGG